MNFNIVSTCYANDNIPLDKQCCSSRTSINDISGLKLNTITGYSQIDLEAEHIADDIISM